VIRQAHAGDNNLVCGTFTGGLSASGAWYACERNAMRAMANLWARQLLTRCTRNLVACNPQNSDHFYGYVLCEPPAIYWVFTKNNFRAMGVASRLIRATRATHYAIDVPVAHRIGGRYGLRHNPVHCVEHLHDDH
jgi:hypothetical protein